jgi:uncharacterized protein (DUF342 family)
LLAVANQFTGSREVEKALATHADLFRKTRKNKLIGDILVANQDLTPANRSAMLLTQDRIKDESLAEAINELAESKREKIELNKRFGAIAVKKGYVNIDQVNQALKQQRREVERGEKKRYLGEILKQNFGLGKEDLLAVLKEQKTYEMQRLNLEKALAQYRSNFKVNQKLSQLFDYRVSDTRLEAFVTMRSEPLEEISTNNFKNWLRVAGIKFGITNDAKIKEFLTNGQPEETLCVALGTPPEQGKHGLLEFLFENVQDPNDGHQTSHPNIIVKKGQPIAKRTPHVEGKPGRDVFGNILHPDWVNTALPGKGSGVESHDNISYTATVEGNPTRYKDRTLFVIPLTEEPVLSVVQGDVDRDTGSTYRKSSLEILGNIYPGGVVNASGLRVWQNLEGTVTVTGSVEVKEKVGRLAPGGKRARIEAGGNVVVARDIENATIITNGRVQAQGGDVISSTILAQRGIFLKNVRSGLGSGMDSGLEEACTLTIGRHETGKLAEIGKDLEQTKKALTALYLRQRGEKTDQNQIDQIKKLEIRVEALTIKRDFLLMEKERWFVPFSPEIKIKNMLEKGTTIKGECSSLLVEQTMYGVKLHEEEWDGPQKTRIIIQGYFE